MNTSDPAAKRGPGRPKTRPAELVRLRVDVTPEEHAIIAAAAHLSGESIAKYARRVLTTTSPKGGGKKSW